MPTALIPQRVYKSVQRLNKRLAAAGCTAVKNLESIRVHKQLLFRRDLKIKIHR